MRVAYLVFDLDDAAVHRRAGLLTVAGADVRLAGFRRGPQAPVTVPGSPHPVLDLGRTRDGRLLARAATVAARAARPGALQELTSSADVLLCRNLETLLVGLRVRRPGQRVVFECLDIHRTVLGAGLPQRMMRAFERWALRRVDGLLTSSPDYVDHYFGPVQGWSGPVLVAENKVPTADGPPVRPPAAELHHPVTIGWFGRLRCARSLAELGEIARADPGAVRVLLAGTPSDDVFPDFEAQIAELPGVEFAGRYRPEDLPALYAQCDIAWAIDYFEEGRNSSWLLPNRLYEALAHGAVPLALAHVATGRWLAARDVGLLVDEAAREVPALVAGLTEDSWRTESDAVASVPDGDVFQLPAERRAITAFVLGT